MSKKNVEPKDWGVCQDCPGRTISPPFNCVIPLKLEEISRQHSGIENQMIIQVTRCHHKEKVVADFPRNKKIIEDAIALSKNMKVKK